MINFLGDPDEAGMATLVWALFWIVAGAAVLYVKVTDWLQAPSSPAPEPEPEIVDADVGDDDRDYRDWDDYFAVQRRRKKLLG